MKYSSNFLVWSFFVNALLPRSSERFARNSAETVHFQDISRPGKWNYCILHIIWDKYFMLYFCRMMLQSIIQCVKFENCFPYDDVWQFSQTISSVKFPVINTWNLKLESFFSVPMFLLMANLPTWGTQILLNNTMAWSSVLRKTKN